MSSVSGSPTSKVASARPLPHCPSGTSSHSSKNSSCREPVCQSSRPRRDRPPPPRGPRGPRGAPSASASPGSFWRKAPARPRGAAGRAPGCRRDQRTSSAPAAPAAPSASSKRSESRSGLRSTLNSSSAPRLNFSNEPSRFCPRPAARRAACMGISVGRGRRASALRGGRPSSSSCLAMSGCFPRPWPGGMRGRPGPPEPPAAAAPAGPGDGGAKGLRAGPPRPRPRPPLPRPPPEASLASPRAHRANDGAATPLVVARVAAARMMLAVVRKRR